MLRFNLSSTYLSSLSFVGKKTCWQWVLQGIETNCGDYKYRNIKWLWVVQVKKYMLAVGGTGQEIWADCGYYK